MFLLCVNNIHVLLKNSEFHINKISHTITHIHTNYITTQHANMDSCTYTHTFTHTHVDTDTSMYMHAYTHVRVRVYVGVSRQNDLVLLPLNTNVCQRNGKFKRQMSAL